MLAFKNFPQAGQIIYDVIRYNLHDLTFDFELLLASCHVHGSLNYICTRDLCHVHGSLNYICTGDLFVITLCKVA